ncbi:hypothetical protein GKZ89_06290 [Bacillus mangrovi]|uniref:Uncharacterized protein n=1 Tax=Metabacillus mangrovi TaxID=1491830 RepID=A0A7X2S3U4_9BACI|nr:hypothetical protein [Metabacillus mangrovi]MTH53015.1 hypothetical protein [Metabacillus mangrovi]
MQIQDTETIAYNYQDMLTIWVKVTKRHKCYSAAAQHPIKRNTFARASHKCKAAAIEAAVKKIICRPEAL